MSSVFFVSKKNEIRFDLSFECNSEINITCLATSRKIKPQFQTMKLATTKIVIFSEKLNFFREYLGHF